MIGAPIPYFGVTLKEHSKGDGGMIVGLWFANYWYGVTVGAGSLIDWQTEDGLARIFHGLLKLHDARQRGVNRP